MLDYDNMYLFFLLGTLINMKYNGKNIYELEKSNHFSMKEMHAMLVALTLKVDTTANNVNKLMYLLITQDSLDISEFFPIKCLKTLNKFMDRTHPQWPLRLKEFKNLLLLCVDDNVKRFQDALLAALFDRDYLSVIKWPSPG